MPPSQRAESITSGHHDTSIDSQLLDVDDMYGNSDLHCSTPKTPHSRTPGQDKRCLPPPSPTPTIVVLQQYKALKPPVDSLQPTQAAVMQHHLMNRKCLTLDQEVESEPLLNHRNMNLRHSGRAPVAHALLEEP